MTDANNMAVTPYLFFGGRTEEALNFYADVLDAKIEVMMRFADAPEKPPEGVVPNDFDNKVMHAAFVVRGTRLLASDGCEEPGKTSMSGFSLTLSVSNEDEAGRIFNGLSKNGSVQMPLGKTFFSPCFGQLTDQFGVQWMVMVPGEM